MSTFDDALKTGHSVVLADTYDGIPWVFAERAMRNVEGAIVIPPAQYALSEALAIPEGTKTSIDCNREEGIAAADELDILLSREVLEDENLLTQLFARPTLRARLTADVTNPAATTFNVNDTSSWGSTGSFYLGRELCTYSSKTGTSFTGITRGYAGLAHYHTANTRSGYRDCTNRPTYWAGRFVTRWEHLCSPEGRYLGTTWCTPGPYCRQVWVGQLMDQPKPTAAGMVLHAQALVRVVAQDIGATISGYTVVDTAGRPMIYYQPTDGLRLVEQASPGLDIEGHPLRTGAGTLADWCAIVGHNLRIQAGTDRLTLTPNNAGIKVAATFDGATTNAFTAASDAWFLKPVVQASSGTSINSGTAFLSYRWNDNQWGTSTTDAWLVVEFARSVDYSDADVPTSGLIQIEVGSEVELARYTDAALVFGGRFHALRLVQRGLYTGVRVNPWSGNSSKVKLITGSAGEQLTDSFAVFATSSGTGARGSFDTLGFGFGLGIPQSFLDLRGWPRVVAPIAVSERTELGELVGGYLALNRQCLAQVVDADGLVVLRAVQTDAVDDADAIELDEDDVLMDGHEEPELVESPNMIQVNTGTPIDVGLNRPDIVVRDSSRIQGEGQKAWEINAPALSDTMAFQQAGDLMVLSDGVQAVRFRLPPWLASSTQPGASVRRLDGHPALYSFGSGAWGETDIVGRIVAQERDHYDGTVTVTMLVAGQAGEALYLCPSADTVGSDSTSSLRVTKGSLERFRVGETVAIYEPGDELSSNEERVIATIVTTNPSYDVVTFTVAMSAVTPGAGLVVTYPEWTSVSTRQSLYMYTRADKGFS
jgi:hypothetical protein